MRKEQQYNSSKQPGCDVNTRHGWYGGGARGMVGMVVAYFASLYPAHGENPSVLTGADACDLKPLILTVQY